MAKANAQLEAKEKKIQADADVKNMRDREALAVDYAKKLKFQEDRFTKKREDLQAEVSGLKELLTEAEGSRKLALKAKAETEGELASLQAQVGSVSDVVEKAKAKDEAARARGRQHERAKMYHALSIRARGALATICQERLGGPLEDNDASYLDFFTKLVEKLESGAKRVNGIIEDECRELLGQAATRIFSNLLRADANFDFNRVMPPVPPELRDGLGKVVEDHVDALLEKFSHGSKSSGEASDGKGEGYGGGDDDGGDDASSS